MIATVLAELPEIGRLNRGETAKLVRVAPINRDLGKESKVAIVAPLSAATRRSFGVELGSW